MIIELDYKPCYKNDKGKWQDAVSIVECEFCGKQREIRKYIAIRKETHYCKKCEGRNRRGSIEEYLELAKSRNFKLIHQAETKKEKSTWKCEKAHQWKAGFCSIRAGTGCPTCANKIPKSIEDYHKLAKEKGFEFLDKEVVNSSTIQKWKCSCGRLWMNNYEKIRIVNGCREC